MHAEISSTLLDEIDRLKAELKNQSTANQPQPIPIHDIDLYGIAAPIAAMNFCSGWSQTTTAALRAAVAAVADANPLLTGRIAKAGEDFMVVPSMFSMEDIFMTSVGPADYTIPAGVSEQVKSMQGVLEPLFKPFCLTNGMATGAPLFRVTVMTLGPGDVCFSIAMSHLIGDGATYYKICDQINTIVNGGLVPKTNVWKAAEESVGIPAHFSEDDKFCLQKSWGPAFMGKLANEPPRESFVSAFDSAAIAALKPLLVAAASDTSVKFLSSNDIIMAGVAEIMHELGDNTCTMMFANMRYVLVFHWAIDLCASCVAEDAWPTPGQSFAEITSARSHTLQPLLPASPSSFVAS
jgi:hypothetical protein